MRKDFSAATTARHLGDYAIDAYVTDALGYLAAGCVFLTFCMKTMLSLRLIAIASNIAFVSYALFAGLTPILVLHGLLLPLNVLRLIQMQVQVRRAGRVAELHPQNSRFDFLVPMGNRRTLPRGSRLFTKGDPADRMYIVTKGEILLPEIGVVLGPGALLGEIALFTGDGQRTVSAEARSDVILAEFSRRRVQEMYFDNPTFAYQLIGIITRRLVENMRALEDRMQTAIQPQTAMAEHEVQDRN